ncbi:MAG TPA: hypothetical protein VJA82_10630 [Sediminibacterium sp.]|uniref:hypothetical protein n=1 Tax=Sediminibacterium sp. TaxID=1917865 RepID=UPI0026B29CBA|nr:hypothetical protein [Sediminibacterium sp.]HLD53752.1 hypothetical protein [Sediminibacterium sp.]
MNLSFTFLLTTPDWINSIAAIAALLTAVITFITVLEIKKQREHSYHPDINISNFEFYVYRYDKEEEDVSMNLYYSKKRIPAGELKNGYNELTIDINNIGLAVAKQVYWYWESDLYEIGRAIKNDEDSNINWVIIERDLFYKAPHLNVDWIYSIDEDNSGSFFSFILPYSIENRNHEIQIPQYYLDLYWLYKTNEVTGEFKNNKKEYPPLQLHVGYTDIHGKEMQKTFLLYMRWSFMSNPLRDESELAKFNIEIFESQ